MYETDQSGHGVEINPLAPDLYIAEQRIIELEAERDKLRDVVTLSADRNTELEAQVAELKQFRDSCVSLTGSLWPQNETTQYLSTLLQDKEKADG